MALPISPNRFVRGTSAYRNSGSGQYLRRTASLPPFSAFSLFGFAVRLSAQNGAYRYLAGIEDATTNATAWCQIGWSSLDEFQVTDTTAAANFPSEPAVGMPFAWALMCDGTIANAHWRPLDRATWVSTANVLISSFTPAALYLGNDSYDEWVDCRLWNVRVWDRALSPSEFGREALSAIPVDTRNLHAWWPLEGGPSQMLRDYSGNHRNLTAGGTGKPGRYFLPHAVMPSRAWRAAVAGAPVLSAPTVTGITTTGATPRVTITI